RARRLVRPGRALAARGLCRKVVELDAVRAGQVALRLRRTFEQLHAHAFAGEIPVATHFERTVAFRDHFIPPYRFHGQYPREPAVPLRLLRREKRLPAAAAEEAACVAQNLRTDEGIGVRAHHNGPRLAAWRPTDDIAWRGTPVDARCAVGVLHRVSHPGSRLLAVLCPSIGRRGEEYSETQGGGNQSNRERFGAHAI